MIFTWQNAHVRDVGQDPPKEVVIKQGLFPRALALSLLLHMLLFWLLHARTERVPPPPETRVRVQLLRPPPAPAVLPSPTKPPEQKPAPEAAPEARQSAAREVPAPREWHRDAREVVRGMSSPQTSMYAPPPTSNAELPAAEPSRVAGLKEAFGPLPGSFDICGRLVEFKFGIHDISMPMAYRCEDKQEEFRSAPGARGDAPLLEQSR